MLPGGGDVVALREVEVPEVPFEQLRPLIGDARTDHLEAVAAEISQLLRGRVVWNVNSTSAGGGVAEMLQVIVGYIRGVGIASRWLAMQGDPAFFAITKRIHNRIHGMTGDLGELGPAETAHYREVTEANAEAMVPMLRAGDIVILHDPQSAGMAARLSSAGAKVIWRCHIGSDRPDPWSRQAWRFLRPHLAACDAFVFSRRTYAPAWVSPERLAVIAPSIDPFSPKNQELPAAAIPSFLQRMGLTDEGKGVAAGESAGTSASVRPEFTRRDGTRAEVRRQARLVGDGRLPAGAPFVVQVSRWDRLKDMAGVMAGFASRVAGRGDAHLILVGPSVDGVADDPEGAEVLADCITEWEALPSVARQAIHLVTLPLDDVDENAAMVNAIQRSATIVVQKSLVEGFGLTVAEGMWKAKPVVGSRVGGITDQIAPGTGILLDDPTDLAAFGDALGALLADPERAARMGEAARRYVLKEFVGDRHLLQYAELIRRLCLTPLTPPT
jgi:trehalose synthase